MNKYLKYITLSVLGAVCMNVPTSQAIVTIDVAEAAGRISSVVGDALRKVQKDLDTTEEKIFGELIGEGNAEAKSLIPTIKDWKIDYAEIKSKIGAATDVYNVADSISSRLGKVDEEINQLLIDKTQIGAGDLEVFKIKQDELNSKISNMKSDMKKLEEELNSLPQDDIASALEIENYLSEYNEQLAQAENDLNILNQSYESLKSKAEEEIQKKLNKLNEEKNKLQNQLEEAIKNKLPFTVNLDNPSAPLSAAKAQNYTSEEVAEKVKENRIKKFVERRNAVTSTYAEAVQLKYRMYKEPDVYKDFETKAEGMDTLAGQIGMDTMMKIKIIELLMQYANMMVADLREYTAKEYANRRFYTMRQPENDLIKFNLDDYVMKDKKEI